MRLLRRLIIMLVILAALAAGADVWVAKTAETKAAEQIQKELDLSKRPTVDIKGFPFLLRVLQGEVPGVTIDGTDLDVQGLDVKHFHVEIESIHASLAELRGGIQKIRVGGGEAFAEITEAATNAYLKRQNERGTVSYGDGTTRITSRRSYGGHVYTVVATGRLEVEKSSLRFTADTVTVDGKPPSRLFAPAVKRDASFSVKLPELPGGIAARRIVVRPGLARLEAEFGSTSLTFGKA